MIMLISPVLTLFPKQIYLPLVYRFSLFIGEGKERMNDVIFFAGIGLAVILGGCLGLVAGAVCGWISLKASLFVPSDSTIIIERRFAGAAFLCLSVDILPIMQSGISAGITGVVFISIFVGLVSKYRKKGFIPISRVFSIGFYRVIRKDERD